MAEQSESSFELRDIWAMIWRRKWFVALPIVLVTILAFAGSFMMQKRYQSSVTILMDQTKYLSRELQALVPGQGNAEGWIPDDERQARLTALRNEITSTAYLTRLVDELEMTKNPAILQVAQKISAEHPGVTPEELVHRILVDIIRGNITVNFIGNHIVQIMAESSSPTEAATVVTKLGEIFKDEQYKRDLRGVRGALDFSDEQLNIYKKNLDEAERKRSDFSAMYLRNQLDESIASDSNIRNIMADVDNLKLQIDNNVREQTRIRTLLSSYKASQLEVDFGNEYERIREATIGETDRLADFMSKYIWSDPKVLNANLAINDHIRDLENVITQKVRGEFSGSTDDIMNLIKYFSLQAREMIMRQKLNDFQVALSTLRDRISRLPQYEVQLRNLDNDIVSARQVYEAFKNQVTGSEISQSLVRDEFESKYRVLEPAAVPLSPYKPNKKKITALGFVLGIAIGGAAMFLMELVDKSFRKVEDVEEFIGVPVLATIPKIDALKKLGKKIHD